MRLADVEGQKRINIFLPVDLWRRLRTRAAETDALMGTVVVTALEDHLGKPAAAVKRVDHPVLGLPHEAASR